MRKRTNMQIRSTIESLESRCMLATFSGTSGADTIDISIQAGGAASIVSINGSVNVTSDPSITINAGEGNDTYRVFRVRTGTTIVARGDGGADTLLNPSTGSRDLDAIYLGALTFEGGLGTDLVIADNTADATTPYEINVTGNAIQKENFFDPFLTYQAVEGVEYYDGEGSNIIKFWNMQFGSTLDVAVEIYGNGGNDTIYSSSSITDTGDWPSAVGTGGALVDGGAGIDALHLSNDSTSGADVYEFIGQQIDVSFPAGNIVGTLVYPNCETLDFVVGNNRDDVVNLHFKFSTVALRFDSGNGNDTFNVGGSDFDETGILLASTTLLGGAGNDHINFNDVQDDQSDGTTSNYTFGVFTFAKGAFGANYSAFETQQLTVANGTVAGLNTVPVVNLHATSAEILNTVIVGGANRLASVNVGNGNVSTVPGTVDVRLSDSSTILNTLNVNNTATTAGVLYRISQTAVLFPRQILYSGVGRINIHGGTGNETFFVDGLASGTVLNLNGNNGDDAFTLGNGNVDADVLGPVAMNGGAGTDNTAVVNNSTDTAVESLTLNGLTYIDGLTHTFSGISDLQIRGGSGATHFALNAVAVRTVVNGGNSNDTFDVGNGDLDANIAPGPSTFASLLIDGISGSNDTIRFNDVNDTVATTDAYTFRKVSGIEQLFRLDVNQHYVSWVNIDFVTLDANNAPQFGSSISTTIVDNITTPLRINGNGGPDSIQVPDAPAPVFVHTGLGDKDGLSVNADGDAIPATVVIDQTDDIENLTVAFGGTLRITPGVAVVKTRLGLNPALDITGELDLAGGMLLSRAGGPALDFFQTRIARGYNVGAWDGTDASGAINSSVAAESPLPDAVGYGLGSEIALTSIGPFSIAPGDTLIRYTAYGDTDLNGVVNFDDYSRTDAGFNSNRTGWVNGDFNYDDVINFDDYSLIDLAFNTQNSLRAGGKHASV